MKVLYVSKGEWKARPSPDEVNEGVVPIRGCGWSNVSCTSTQGNEAMLISEAPLNT